MSTTVEDSVAIGRADRTRRASAATGPATGPVQEHLVYLLTGMIDRGEYSPSGRLPSQRELAQRFGVARNTVRAALETLCRRELIVRRRGRGGGSIVCRADPNRVPVVRGLGLVASGKMQRRPGLSVSVPQLLQEQGFIAATRVLDVEVLPGDAEATEKLGLLPDADVVRIDRVRLSNSEPLSYERAFVPHQRFEGIEHMDFMRSLLEILKTEYGVEAKDTTERIEVLGASREHARLLGIKPGSPVFFITRWTADAQGRGVEFSRDYFRVDRTQLFVHSARA